jgi:hypothetical protein
LDEALARCGRPEIFNTDQGSQFTSTAFTGRLSAAGISISMDGRGRWLDNVFIERLWRSLKYEEVYLKAYADGHEARAGIGAWFAFYNRTRPHQALAGRMPIAVWQAGTASPGETAVDMTLPPAAASLDDAFASPTWPPRQPQQQPLARRQTTGTAPSTLAKPSRGPHHRVHLRGEKAPCRSARSSATSSRSTGRSSRPWCASPAPKGTARAAAAPMARSSITSATAAGSMRSTKPGAMAGQGGELAGVRR